MFVNVFIVTVFNASLFSATELSAKYELVVPTLSVKVKRIEDMSSASLGNIKIPHGLKRRADDTHTQEPRKRGRPADSHSPSPTKREFSRVVTDENSTSVERHTVSGRKLKFVCYRRLNAGEIDKYGRETSLHPKIYTSPLKSTKSETLTQSSPAKSKRIGEIPPLPSNNKSPCSSQSTHTKFKSPSRPKSTKPESLSPPELKSGTTKIVAPSNVTKHSTEEKLGTIKKIGKIRSLRDNEICDLLVSESEDSSTSSDSEDDDDDDEPEVKTDRTATVKGDKQRTLLDRISDLPLPDCFSSKTVTPSKLASKETKAQIDVIKDSTVPEVATPKKGRREEQKSKSTIKKRFTCDECQESFTTSVELRDHEEDHEDFEPVSKTPGR